MSLALSTQSCIFTAVLCFGIGFTLLSYSRDGDFANRVKTKTRTVYSDPVKTSEKDAWDQLKNLANSQLVEVTWNTFMFVSLVSAMVFLGLSSKILDQYKKQIDKNDKISVGAPAFLFVLIVFCLQDLVHKWRNAHRRHPLLKEMTDIMERLEHKTSK